MAVTLIDVVRPCTCGACVDCRLRRKRQGARERKARERRIRHAVDECLPLFDVSEQAGWIDRALAVMDAARKRTRRGWCL